MKISLSWLSRYIDAELDVDELVEVLPMLGLEVDAVETLGLPPLKNVVVGEILSREQHPNADRLGVCQVKVDEHSDPLQIVCGATNYAVGDRVPVALHGAKLPDGFKIKRSKLRGVESNGMMCSARELGLGDDHEGLLILDTKPAIGTPINEVFTENDTVLTLEVTANRGDCLSYRGVAYELAARLEKPLKSVAVKTDIALAEAAVEGFPLQAVRVETKRCPYYTLWGVRGVKVAPSPDWLQRDLRAAGLRPINNIVDITNWVLLETGQPLHAFDSDKIAGNELIVRQATEGEAVVTLDGKKRVLTPAAMVIADAEKPLVIAGVMGTETAEVAADTQNIVLESAWFEPAAVRATARKLNLHTDSSNRFARDVDPAEVVGAARRALDLIVDIAGGEVVQCGVVVGQPPRGDNTIELSSDFVRARCGFDVSVEAMQSIFERLGFEVAVSPQEKASQPGQEASTDVLLKVTVPSRRGEVQRPIDLVEEFVRLYGTERIPAAKVSGHGLSRRDDARAVFQDEAASYLLCNGLTECCHYSLRKGAEIAHVFGESSREALSLANPLTADHSHLRPSLLPGLLDAWRLNRNQGTVVNGLFEVGRVFQSGTEGLYELIAVSALLPAREADSWLKRPSADFYTAKAMVENIAHLAGIEPGELCWSSDNVDTLWQPQHAAYAANWEKKGFGVYAGLLNLSLLKEWDIDSSAVAFEVLLQPDFLLQAQNSPRYQPFSHFPPSSKDLALVVPEAEEAELVRRTLVNISEASLRDEVVLEAVELFDVYQGKGVDSGYKSLAFNLVFRSAQRTLSDEWIAPLFQTIQDRIEKETTYRVRR